MQPQQEFTILVNAPNSDASFMTALKATTGDFSFVLQVPKNSVIKSTGLMGIPSGVVTATDVGRVLEAAMTLTCKENVIVSTSFEFSLDEVLNTKFMPIGMPAKRLDVTVKLVRIPKGILKRWHDWAMALERHTWLVGVLKFCKEMGANSVQSGFSQFFTTYLV